MIIKSHVRGGYRAAADYLKDIGANEKIRLVELNDPGAKDIDDAFRNMWLLGKTTRAQKPLHHVSINPYKDERLTDARVMRICERLEQKYGYRHGEHHQVIVEHVKDGRRHFHVMWNRVSMRTGRPVWPGQHWNKSKQAAREMEVELGLKRPMPRRQRRARSTGNHVKHKQRERASYGRNRAGTITRRYLRVCKHHCATGAYGWTRRGRGQDCREVVSIWCLLDRGPVWEQMTSCDRYELREAQEG